MDFVYSNFNLNNYDKENTAFEYYAILEELRNTELGSFKVKDLCNCDELSDRYNFGDSFIKFYNNVFKSAKMNITVEDYNKTKGFDNGDLTLLEAFCLDFHFIAMQEDDKLNVVKKENSGVNWYTIEDIINGESDKKYYTKTRGDINNLRNASITAEITKITSYLSSDKVKNVQLKYKVTNSGITMPVSYSIVLGVRDVETKKVLEYSVIKHNAVTEKEETVGEKAIQILTEELNKNEIEPFVFIVSSYFDVSDVNQYADIMNILDESLYTVQEDTEGFYITSISDNPIYFNVVVQYADVLISNDLFSNGTMGRNIELLKDETVFIPKTSDEVHKVLIGCWYDEDENMEWENIENLYSNTISHEGKDVVIIDG